MRQVPYPLFTLTLSRAASLISFEMSVTACKATLDSQEVNKEYNASATKCKRAMRDSIIPLNSIPQLRALLFHTATDFHRFFE